MIEGHFIVLEGVDGSGTTTQAQELGKALSARGLPVHVTREPSDGPIGTLIRQALSGRYVVPGGRPLDWATMATLFAADRLDHLNAEVVPNLRDGVTVISDRYDYSSVAYQSVSGGGGAEVITWIRELNRKARRPDLTLVLDVDPEVAEKRRAMRSASPDLYEEREFQAQLGAFYADIDQHFSGDRIVHISGNRDLHEVSSEILEQVLKFRGG